MNTKRVHLIMRNLFFLTLVFSLFVTMAVAQSSKVRGGAQPAASSAIAPVRPATTPRSNNTPTISKRSNTSSAEVKKSEDNVAAKSRGSETSPSPTLPRPTAKTKTPTIPASTTTGSRSGQQAAVKAAPLKPATIPQMTIKWMTIEEALGKSKTEKRKIFIDVYTDWCGWCKHMDSTTFKDQAVVAYINEKYYSVKLNAEQTSDITYKGTTYKFVKQNGGRGYHELAALWLNNRLSYPTSVVLNEDQDLIQPIPGFQDTKKMDAILHYFGTDSHRKTPWEKYEKTYAREK